MSLSKRKRKKIDTTPFDRNKMPPKQNMFVMPFMWLYCYIVTRKSKLRINKVGMKGLKPPYLVLGSHHAFMDFLVTPLTLFPHRANYISELEGFEYYGEWPYRQIGCLGTRKFVDDLALVKNIKRVIDRKGIMVIYPEARYCNVGTNSTLLPSVGKLIKMLKVPVVVLNMRGNYLQSPIWNLTIRKEAILDATITKVLDVEDISEYSVEEITNKLQGFFTYDDYEWQYNTKQAITYEKRAEGLHMPLYRCPSCNTDFVMNSAGDKIFCTNCNKTWHMTEYGKLETISGDAIYEHIPDWYEYERLEVIDEILRGEYSLDIKVHIESLPNAKNFIDLGEGRLIHSKRGFTLYFKDYNEEETKQLHFSPISTPSIHTEYNYRDMGQCITLSTLNNTYFIFPLEEGFNATKMQFATEYMYELSKEYKRHR